MGLGRVWVESVPVVDRGPAVVLYWFVGLGLNATLSNVAFEWKVEALERQGYRRAMVVEGPTRAWVEAELARRNGR